MKKHRISASLLSLALAVSLCAPAWAAETPTPEEETALAEKYALEAPVEGTYLVNGQEVFTLPEGADPTVPRSRFTVRRSGRPSNTPWRRPVWVWTALWPSPLPTPSRLR